MIVFVLLTSNFECASIIVGIPIVLLATYLSICTGWKQDTSDIAHAKYIYRVAHKNGTSWSINFIDIIDKTCHSIKMTP